MFITSTMGVLRYVNIRAPLWAFGYRRTITAIAIVAVVVDSLYSLVISGVGAVWLADCWISLFQGVTDSKQDFTKNLYLFIEIPFYAKVGTSILFSSLTVLELRSEQGQQLPDIKRRSIIMIILLNLGNAVWLVMCLLGNLMTSSNSFDNSISGTKELKYESFYVLFVTGVLAQSLLAAYNPLVICTRNTNIRRMIGEFVRSGRVGVIATFTSLGTGKEQGGGSRGEGYESEKERPGYLENRNMSGEI